MFPYYQVRCFHHVQDVHKEFKFLCVQYPLYSFEPPFTRELWSCGLEIGHCSGILGDIRVLLALPTKQDAQDRFPAPLSVDYNSIPKYVWGMIHVPLMLLIVL